MGGKTKEAITVVRRALAINCNDCNILNNLGFYCYLEEDYVEAEKYLLLCLKREPKLEFTNSTLAMLLFHTNRCDEAIGYFEIALTIPSDTNNPDIAPQMLYKYGLLLCQMKKYELCSQILRRIVENTAFCSFLQMNDVYSLLASVYDALGSSNLAIDCRSKVAVADGNDLSSTMIRSSNVC